MNPLMVRVTCTRESINHLTVTQFFDQQHTPKTKDIHPRVFCVYELGKNDDNPHYQALVYTSMQNEAYRAHLRKHFNAKGNNDYSIKKCKDPEDYTRYICKGTKQSKPVLLYSRGFEEVNIEHEHTKYWETNQKIKERTKHNRNFLTKILHEIEETKETINTPEQALTYLIKYYTDNYRVIPNFMLLRQQVISILLHTSDKQKKANIQNKIFNKVLENLYSE